MIEDEDGGIEDEGPVVVTRAAFEAGMELRAEVCLGADGPAFEIARARWQKGRAAGDEKGAAFWKDVFDFLMWEESVGAGTPTVILEPGESWDWAEGRVQGRKAEGGADEERS